MQFLLLCLAFCSAAVALPALPASADQPAAKPFDFFRTPLVGRREAAIVASAEADEDDEQSRFAGYGQGPASSAEVPPSSDAFLVEAPPAVRESSAEAGPATEGGVLGVAPKFTGSFRKPLEETVQRYAPAKEPITNPAAFFLAGADLSKVAKPSCHMVGCDGPVANDADLDLVPNAGLAGPNALCHQAFVPLNGCVDGKGYPVGMVCTVCCDCTASFKLEMSKSAGFKQGFRAHLD